VQPFFRLVFAALLCIGACATWAQEQTGVSASDPMLLPKTILALRGDQGDRARLELTFDRTRDGEAAAPLTVWIGADYFASIEGERLTIVDLRLIRRFVVNRRTGTLVNLSLYGDVMFRRVELVRRLEIATALAKEPDRPVLPQSLDRYWIESELGIDGPGKLPAATGLEQDGATTRFLYGGRKVASATLGDTAVPRDLAHSYGAFLRRSLPLHPSIARWLGQSSQVPSRLEFSSEARGKTEKISLRLKSAATVSADYPMPRRLSLVLLPWGERDPEVALMREILPHVAEAMAARATDGAGQIEDYRAAIDRDFKVGHKFAAALRLTELALRWGRSATQCETGKDDGGPCRGKQDIDRMLRDDPRSVAMFKATALQESQPAKALAIWRDLDRHDVPNGYVVDIFVARLLSERGDRVGAARSFVAAFTGDPSIVVLYRELGDHFARVSRLDLAWLCYDLGRALPNRTTPDALSGIDIVEQELAKTYPDMF
jgi:hypothetical protein